MKTIYKYFDLSNITDNPNKTTIALFNSCREILKDEKGHYNWVAFDTHLNGILAKKVYL